MPFPARKRATAASLGFRSGLEAAESSRLERLGVEFEYEPKDKKIRYVKPATNHKYTPDFVLSNGIIVETKGRFLTADRQKHLYIKEQHPDLDIRFVFSRSKTPISKGSKTTYASWCEKHGFLFADAATPLAWLEEPPQEARIAAISKAIK